jgi:transcriptional regulator with XRE-family HTH domain
MSQHGLAWRVGLNQSTISRLENGKLQSLRFKNLALIAGVLSLPPDFFLVGGPPAPTRRMPHQPPRVV